MLPPETDPSAPTRPPGGQGERPLERRIQKLTDAGCSDIEIARRFRRSAPGIARVRALADLHIPSSRPAVRAGSLRPIERRVVRWADAGADPVEIGRRFGRSSGHISRIEVLARRKLSAIALSP